jgi:uncharacterized low-complexity protein
MLVMGFALLGCSESAPVVASMSASTMLAKTTGAPPVAAPVGTSPANGKNEVAVAPGSIVVERCREADATTGKCVDAMCVSYVGKGVWSEHFECVP